MGRIPRELTSGSTWLDQRCTTRCLQHSDFRSPGRDRRPATDVAPGAILERPGEPVTCPRRWRGSIDADEPGLTHRPDMGIPSSGRSLRYSRQTIPVNASPEGGLKMLLRDRGDAGRLLAVRLLSLRDADVAVIGLARGGVPAAYETGRAQSYAQRAVSCRNKLTVVHGATHLFPEPCALEQVAALARDWFLTHLTPSAIGSRGDTGKDNARS